MKELDYEETFHLKKILFLDVRSPLEFKEDHLPQAINLPIFDDQEKKTIGKIYRSIGQEEAILKGISFMEKKLSSFFQEINNYKKYQLVIYCARGGMRSTAVVSLINSLGIAAYKLKKGYKGYRKYLISQLEHLQVKPPLFILQGLTGVGKTELIKNLENSIDLENLAGHRSSVFGGLGLKKKSQKNFESLFWEKITFLQDKKYLVVEGESRKIGNIYLPWSFFSEMKKGLVIMIKSPLENRIKRIIKEYGQKIDLKEILSLLPRIESKIGREKINLLKETLLKKDLETFVKILLENYYDPLYRHSLKKLNYIAEIENLDTNTSAEKIKKIINKHLSS